MSTNSTPSLAVPRATSVQLSSLRHSVHLVRSPYFLSVAVLILCTAKNPYDISRDCEGNISETLCYPLTKHINTWLDRPDIRAKLGVADHIGNFSSCSPSVGAGFRLHQDRLHTSQAYVAELLERGVRVLIYAGTYDWSVIMLLFYIGSRPRVQDL